MSKQYVINKKNADDYKKFLYDLLKCYNEFYSIWGDKGPYKDPDIESSGIIEYYNDLTKYLNNMEEEFKFIEKYNYEFSYDKEFSDEENKIYGIKVKDVNERLLFYLKSDQLGFSAPGTQFNHPYDTYLIESSDKDKIDNVCEWISTTRTIGSGFLWPMEQSSDGKWKVNPDYNLKRGGSSNYGTYIEDRVDLTLLEIKHFYDYNDNNISYDRDILYKYYYNKYSNMYKWLMHFGTFENYIKYFKFEAFVDENFYPKSIIDLERVQDEYKKEIYGKSRMKIDDIKNMLCNLSKMVTMRSKNMEEKFI